ncbi:MAG: hypothetical protein ACP5ER_03845, partial [Candidatus Bathyarchaeales archaeon]
YRIEQVSHTIKVLYDGYIFINDTVWITGQALGEAASLQHFLIGFPYKYGPHILRCTARNASETFPVRLNVPLENHVGFYGVEINFPQPLNISNGTTHSFTVEIVLSNDLLTQYAYDPSRFTLDFPAYPSLTKTVAICNVSIVIPNAEYISGTVDRFEYSEENLPPFSYSPGNLTFSVPADEIQMFEKELKREIRISGVGEIEVSDTYNVMNKGVKEIGSIELILPPNASNPIAQNRFGRQMQLVLTDAEINRYRITLTLPLNPNLRTRFTLKYHLPREVYITQETSDNFNFKHPSFRHINYYIEQLSVTIVLPEGARILNFKKASLSNSYNVARNVFQETITINCRGVISLDSFDVETTYVYNLLWLAFRPTLWMWALTMVGCAIAVVWKRPKAPAPIAVPRVAIRLSPEDIKSFINAYEEKRKIILEIKSLESRARKGKIPRRRYKVRRKTLETRLNTLSKNLTELEGKMRAVGGAYADFMRQLEVAETEMNEVEANIKSIRARHRRGELSLEAYRKLLADYERRKEKSETTINGILIRLREEIR